MQHYTRFLVAICILCAAPAKGQGSYKDLQFQQEYHEAYPINNDPRESDVRSVTVDANGNAWIATAAGVRVKYAGQPSWHEPAANGYEEGPAFCVLTDKDGKTWMGNWNGAKYYDPKQNKIERISGTDGPISAICTATEGVYLAGPKGIWLYSRNSVQRKNYKIPRSLRRMISDKHQGLWIASDVGIYHCTASGTKQFVDRSSLLSASVKGLALDAKERLWAAGLGGISILEKSKQADFIGPKQGCPSVYLNCISKGADGTMWVGTDAGLVRYASDGSHSLRFSRRWLLDDLVRDISFDREGNAWIATAKGVSVIRKKMMTLSDKQEYFYDVLMKRHIREPWIAGQCHLKIPGDVNSWQAEDDDNDGEYTGNYLAMESFRYAVTKSADAREKAVKAFNFLKLQEEITGGDGYFARTIVPAEWKDRVHDGNVSYTPQQLAEELVKEPRFKPVEIRWRPSADGKWLWKGDASSDEWCGHMLGYYFFYELAADEAQKEILRKHISKLLDHLINHNYNMMDVDGTATRWSVWSPESLNRDPEWQPDQSQNSMELLAFFKLGYYMTNNEKYQRHYLHLVNEEHYLENMANITKQNPAWFIYFDVMMQSYLYPILTHCEKDPRLLSFYRKHLDEWMQHRKGDMNPQINFTYSYCTGNKAELPSSIAFLKDTPLDLVDWHIDHTRRADIRVVHEPVLEELQVSDLPPASIRQVVRWDKNPWTAVGGSPDMEREPVFWLLPYWMGRYLEMIR